MPYAILRVAKLGSWGEVGASGAHTYRTRPTPNADPARTKALNATLVGTPGDVVADVRARVEAVTAKPRANAVLCVETLLTASPEFFAGKRPAEVRRWADRQVAFLRDRFGPQNVVHACLHLDETTPHVVAYLVPEKDGKLNCRAILGGREKLRDLQTAYADAMRPLGLERGVEGSKARHQRVRRWYSVVNAVDRQAAGAVQKLAAPAPPPEKRLLQSRDSHAAEMAAWSAGERQRVQKLTTAAGRAIVMVKSLREEVAALRASNGALEGTVERQREELSRLYREMGLSREEVSALRRLDISAVAAALGHMGEVMPKENAIDLAKRVGEFTYEQAVAWLASTFGPEHAGAAVREHAEVSAPARPLTPGENRIKAEMLRQLEALGCDRYRLSLIAEGDGGAKPYLPGKHGDKEQFYTKEDLVNLIPWLRLQNNQGRHVFVTPMDDNAYYVLIDDLRVSPAELEAKGFKPCLVQKTSWEKHQVMLKITKDLDRRAAIDVFNELNKRIGDPEMTGLRHPMRLAGFRNVKEKYRRDDPKAVFPFVQVISAVNRFCGKTIELVKQRMTAARPATPAEAPAGRRPRP